MLIQKSSIRSNFEVVSVMLAITDNCAEIYCMRISFKSSEHKRGDNDHYIFCEIGIGRDIVLKFNTKEPQPSP